MVTNMFPNPVEKLNGIFLQHLVNRLRPMGYEFRVISTIPQPPFPLYYFGSWKQRYRKYPDKVVQDGIEVRFTRYPFSYKLVPARYFGNALWHGAGRELRQITREFKPDLLWCQPALPDGWAAMKLSRLFKIPYVIVVHGADMNETVHLKGASSRLTEVYGNATHVITVSNRLKREVEDRFKSVKCQTIHQGFDTELVKEARENQDKKFPQGETGDKITVISISKLRKTKGIEYNLRVLKILAEKYRGLVYHILGDGEERNRLEAITRDSSLDDRVEFHGRVSHREAYHHLAAADFLSLPSYREGLGIVYIESMALGIPAIGCAGQGIADIIEDGVNGFLVPPHDIQALANTWEKLIIDRSLRKRIGRAGMETVSGKFSWEKIAGEYDRVFRQAAP